MSQSRRSPWLSARTASRLSGQAAAQLLLRFAWFAAVVCLVGCPEPTQSGPPPSVTPPACTAVGSFGNGAICEPVDDELTACGGASRRTCASSWLCFDAPELLLCACSADADCESRTFYINQGRLLKKKAPLAPHCEHGRCVGMP